MPKNAFDGITLTKHTLKRNYSFAILKFLNVQPKDQKLLRYAELELIAILLTSTCFKCKYKISGCILAYRLLKYTRDSAKLHFTEFITSHDKKFGNKIKLPLINAKLLYMYEIGTRLLIRFQIEQHQSCVTSSVGVNTIESNTFNPSLVTA